MKRSTVVFYWVGHQGKHLAAYRLPLVDTDEGSSFSVVMSLSAYLCWKYPSLPTPDSLGTEFKVQFHAEDFPNLHAVLHPMYTRWADLFCRCVDRGDAVREAADCYFRLEVGEAYAQELERAGLKPEHLPPAQELSWERVRPGLSEHAQAGRQTVLFISCSLHTGERPRISLSSLYYGMYFNNERWRSFNLFEDGQPSDELYREASLVIVPGSSLSVNCGRKEIQDLILKLQQMLQASARLRVLGVCFGCQLVAPVFGGKVGKAQVGTYGLSHIGLDHQAIQKLGLPFLDPLKPHKELCVSQFHGDEVSELPPDFTVVSSSANCRVEIMVSNDGRCLAIQCHPEYSVGFVRAYELRLLHHGGAVTEEDIRSKAVQKPQKYDEGSAVLREVVRAYIRDGMPSGLPHL